MKRRAEGCQTMLNNPRFWSSMSLLRVWNRMKEYVFEIWSVNCHRIVSCYYQHLVGYWAHCQPGVVLKDGRQPFPGTQERDYSVSTSKSIIDIGANNEVEMWQKQFKVSNMKTLSDGINYAFCLKNVHTIMRKRKRWLWRTYSYIISERKQMMIMTYYEIKSFSKKSKVALIFIFYCNFSSLVFYHRG